MQRAGPSRQIQSGSLLQRIEFVGEQYSRFTANGEPGSHLRVLPEILNSGTPHEDLIATALLRSRNYSRASRRHL
jgi:hypothetical protein